MDASYKYDVALSFAGEDRAYVKMVADCLAAKGVRVFYDSFEQADLWGKNLYDHLIEIYQKSARSTVVFISEHYRAKVWTNHERRAAQARALNESGEYILPARFDDTQLEGLLPTIAYIDLRTHSPREVCELLCQKLGREPLQAKAHALPSPCAPALQGTATFNYSSHNGRFRIGEGIRLFETAWGKASGTAIHCTTDTASVRGVATAPRGITLAEIKDASEYDFTSRVRTPEEGRFVILQNIHGLYAALEVVDVKDDTRGDVADELTFRYWILADGSDDFSALDSGSH